MNRPLRVGLIGAGRIAQTWAAALQTTSSCSLDAVADIDADAARALAGHRDAFGSHLELIARARPDAVIIATPPQTHDTIAIDACRAGVHVLCEKPFAIDTRRAEAMAREAHQNAVRITMASKFRFVESVREARARLERGDIGELVLFENTFSAAVDMRGRWNCDAKMGGGGVLMDNGAHSLDLFRYFAGAPSAIHCVEGARLQGLDVEETVHMFLKTEAGARGSIDLSWSIDKTGTDLLRLYGTRGRIDVGWQGARAQVEGRWTSFGKGYDKLTSFCEQLDDFARSVLLGAEMQIDSGDALGSVAAVETAYRALDHDAGWSRVSTPRTLVAV